MKLRTIIAAFAAGVAVAAPAAAEEQVYYCTSELGTGISKDEQTGQWEEGGFRNIRFTMKFGERTKGSAGFYNRELVLSRNGRQEHFICDVSGRQTARCVEVFPSSIEPFFADDPNPNIATLLSGGFLFTDLQRFELYRGSPYAFVKDGEDNSAMYAGTCETF